jgi:hypothetical protein
MILAFLLANLAPASSPEAQCLPVAGQELLWATTSARYVIFGELHGTAELPALFGDVVCEASRDNRVVVGLEYDRRHQPALDAYLTSDGGRSARETLLSDMQWPANDLADGRTSQAMLALIERLRLLKSAGADLSVIAFRPRFDPSAHAAEGQEAGERGMAHSWSEIAAAHPQARFLILVGNLHARRSESMGIRWAAMHLPAAETITLVEALPGGEAWTCQAQGCGPHPLGRSGTALPRGIYLSPVRDGPSTSYDGRYSPGRPVTPSPPASPHSGANP